MADMESSNDNKVVETIVKLTANMAWSLRKCRKGRVVISFISWSDPRFADSSDISDYKKNLA